VLGIAAGQGRLLNKRRKIANVPLQRDQRPFPVDQIMKLRIGGGFVSMLLGLVAFLVSIQANAAGVVVLRGTWSAGNGNDYAFVALQGATWDQAQADVAAVLPGYHLATVTSAAEDVFLVSLNAPGGQWWLGGFQYPPTQPVATAGWTWVTGEPWAYTNWALGEPNDAGVPGNEQHLGWYTYGGWNDEGSAIGSISGYVAEREAAPPPPAAEIPALSLLAQTALAALVAGIGVVGLNLRWNRRK
jgi:hypothetical protein